MSENENDHQKSISIEKTVADNNSTRTVKVCVKGSDTIDEANDIIEKLYDMLLCDVEEDVNEDVSYG